MMRWRVFYIESVGERAGLFCIGGSHGPAGGSLVTGRKEDRGACVCADRPSAGQGLLVPHVAVLTTSLFFAARSCP